MDAAIADFSKRLGAQEQELYAGLHRALSHLPVPGKVEWEGAHSRKYQLLECRVHAHIDILKSVAGCTNNNDVFMCIVHFHACRGFLQHYQTLLQELEGLEEPSAEAPSEQESGASTDSYEQDCTLLRDRNLNVECETGIRSPSYEVMCCREKMLSRMSASPLHIV